ncbi:MAG: hypothetical protein KA508_05425, partial [Gammaproteobacteria bacterium]|nr:hypothetical protein [Gammaproteobacteria bacterium]
MKEIRLRLAYTWLLSTQPGLAAITPAEQSESKAQILDSLVLARREHNTDADIEGGPISPIDYPSCFAGVKSRIALSWPQFQLMKSGITIQQVVANAPVWSEIEYALGAAVAECAINNGLDPALQAVDNILAERLDEPGLSCYKSYLDYFFTVDREDRLSLRQAVYDRLCHNLLQAYTELQVELTGSKKTQTWQKKDIMPII